MDKERFTEILKGYSFPAHLIDELWDDRPDVPLDEDRVRGAAEYILPRVKLANHITEKLSER